MKKGKMREEKKVLASGCCSCQNLVLIATYQQIPSLKLPHIF